MRKTGLLWDNLFEKHLTGIRHPESPNRLRAIYQTMMAEGLDKSCERVPIRAASEEELLLIHRPRYVQTVQDAQGRDFVSLDPDTWMTEKSYEAAVSAVGGGINLVDAIWDGELDNGFALVRPPGHHAEADRSAGFCLFNNIAIAAEHLIRNRGVKRVAVVDWDVHHGNGTHNSFYKRSDVLYCSTHQFPFFPGSGRYEELGSGAGEGYSLNIPLRAGADDRDYYLLYQHGIVPVLEEFNPDFLLISAGMDIHHSDLIGGMKLTSGGVSQLARLLIDGANRLCDGKVCLFLEGGYDLDALSECTVQTIKILQDDSKGPQAPDYDLGDSIARSYLGQCQKALGKYWKCLEGLSL